MLIGAAQVAQLNQLVMEDFVFILMAVLFGVIVWKLVLVCHEKVHVVRASNDEHDVALGEYVEVDVSLPFSWKCRSKCRKEKRSYQGLFFANAS